jgi:cyclase
MGMKLMSLGFACVAFLLMIKAVGVAQQLEHFKMQKINDHVYAFIGWDPTLDLVDGNSYAVLTDEGVFVVDTHQPPICAEANIAEIRKLTNKPVKFILNTHWHGDHNMGNFVYKKAFPEAKIIAQTATREILARRQADWVKEAREGEYAKYIADFEKMLSDGKGYTGNPITEVERERIAKLMVILKKYDQDVRRDEVCIPDMTFEKNLTLYMGGVEIQIRHDGRANTPGDAYVWLPADSILITGDILVHPIPYCFGSNFDEWPAVMDTMLALKPKIILPGHGEVMTDTGYMRMTRDLLADMFGRSKRVYESGVTAADSLNKAVDMFDYRVRYTKGDPALEWVFDNYVVGPALPRILKILKNELGDDKKAN